MGYIDRLLGKPSLADFATLFIRTMQEAGETEELRFDAAGGRIFRHRDGKVVEVINLGGMYTNYLAKPRAERPGFLRLCVRGALTTRKALPTEFDDARCDLRPKLWGRTVMEQARLRVLLGEPAGFPVDPSFAPIGEHLLLLLAYDWPEAVQSISREDLNGWGVSFYEAMEPAKQNLAETPSTYSKMGDHFYAFNSGDTYDAARLMLADRIQELEVLGKPVAMVPNRDWLLVTGSEDPLGLDIMADLASKGLQGHYGLSGIPLILDDGAWTDWMPPADHPSHRRFRELELNWIGNEYTEQKALLDAVHERQGVDLCVASFSAVKKPDGEQVSFCIWGEGVDSLLPVTHKVAFMQMSRKNMAVFGEWSRVVEAAGELMELTDHYPRRYRVREFPEKEILSAIGLGEL